MFHLRWGEKDESTFRDGVDCPGANAEKHSLIREPACYTSLKRTADFTHHKFNYVQEEPEWGQKHYSVFL